MHLTPEIIERAIQHVKEDPEQFKTFVAQNIFRTDVQTFDKKINQIRQMVNEKSNLNLPENANPIAVLQGANIISALYLHEQIHSPVIKEPTKEGLLTKISLEMDIPDFVVAAHYTTLAIDAWIVYILVRLVHRIEELVRKKHSDDNEDASLTPGQIHDMLLLISFLDMLINNMVVLILLTAGAVYVFLKGSEYDIQKLLVIVAIVLRVILWIVRMYYTRKLEFILDQTQWQLYAKEIMKRGISVLDNVINMLQQVKGKIEVPETLKQALLRTA